MKKLSFLLLMFSVLSFSSCEDDHEDDDDREFNGGRPTHGDSRRVELAGVGEVEACREHRRSENEHAKP